jgi:HK97 family phage portal protein
VAFVVSDGALTSIHRAAPPTVPYQQLRLADDYYADYAAIWKTQPAVRTVVTFLARNIASLGIHVFRRLSDTDRERLSDHPLAALMGRPNPYTTPYRLINALVHDLGIYDAAYWGKVYAGEDRAIVRVPPALVRPKGDSWVHPEKFEIRGNKGKREVNPEEVVYFHGYRPEDDREGCSSIESLRRILAEEFEAGRYREQTLRNGARMSGYIKRPKEAGDWSPDAKKKFRSQWQSQYSGNGPQAGGTPILEDGMEFVPASQTAEQLQYVETRKLTREEVAAAYFIPPPMVGLLDQATYSNIEQQHRMLYQDTLGPWLVQIEQEIELQLIPDMPDNSGVYVEFNIAEKLKGSFEQQATAIQTMVGGPVMTRNEGRARLNLPSKEGGDELITPLNVIEGGQASPTDSAPLPKASAPGVKSLPAKSRSSDEEAITAAVTKFFGRQARVVKSRLGAKALDAEVWDEARWDRELAADLLKLSVPVATSAGRSTLTGAEEDPDLYDEARTSAYLEAMASGVAHGINTTTATQVEAALDQEDPDAALAHVFETAAQVRAAEIAVSLVTNLMGFGATEAAKHAGVKASKTWRTTSGKPRSTHSAMSGQTVALDKKFSNGAMWPGDTRLPEDQRAGCRCVLDINILK